MSNPIGWIALTATLAACGVEDPDLQDLSAAANAASYSQEVTTSTLLMFRDVNLYEADPAVLSRASDVVNTVLGRCVQVTPATSGSGLTVDFGEGCGLPLTNLQFRGALGATVKDQSLTFVADGFAALDLSVDGSFALERNGDETLYKMNKLTAFYGDFGGSADGSGVFTVSPDRTAVDFSGSGSVEYDGERIAFSVDRLHRSLLNDCYPSSGTIEVRSEKRGLTLTLRFDDSFFRGLDSDDSGHVYVDFRGDTFEYALPRRACS